MEAPSLLNWLSFLYTRVVFAGIPDADIRLRGWSLLVVGLLPAALLYPSLGFHLLEPDEGRYAQIPKEMLLCSSWVVPILQGEPYLDKPPLMYWLIAGSYQVFGITPWAARLVPAVCVHLTILAVYLLGRRSIGERGAFWAAVLLSVAPGFIGVARLLLLDGLLTLCVAVSVICGFEAVRTGHFRPAWWLISAVASGLGFLTKGPISEVLLFVPLWMFWYLTNGWSQLPTNSIASVEWTSSRRSATVPLQWYAIFAAIVIAVNLPWYVAMYREQPQFLAHFFWQHNILRFLQPFDHLQPIWYYLPILLGGLLPGTLLLIPYFRQLFRCHQGTGAPSPAGGFWLLAGLWCVVFFSCSGSKLPTYILPAYPFVCLALGEFLAKSRGNTVVTTRVLVGTLAIVMLLVHHYGLPWYAQERSPYGRPELVERFLTDTTTTVVCFPRHCDSLAFYSDRSDFRNVRTKDINQLFVDCHHRPQTVILFTHRESFRGFKQTLPPSLAIVESVSLHREYHHGLLNKLFGSTPWGLCDVAVVVPLAQVPPQ
jgi:4-amino-4-deoxy-L-arabinose transferase-like glycosyltransferase